MIRLDFLCICGWAVIAIVDYFREAKSDAWRVWAAVCAVSALFCAMNVYRVLP